MAAGGPGASPPPDLREEDVFWCTADIGWVTGHPYIVYGPLANGATTVMYEGTPDWPDEDRFWRIVEKYAVTILDTIPKPATPSRAGSSCRPTGRRCAIARAVAHRRCEVIVTGHGKLIVWLARHLPTVVALALERGAYRSRGEPTPAPR